MSSSLNVQLTDALRKYVDERASDRDVYATPSERKRMRAYAASATLPVKEGLHGR